MAIKRFLLATVLASSVAASIALAQGSASTDALTCAEVRRVAEWDFLYIRARPDHRSASVGAIDPLTDKKILLNGECMPRGGSDRDAWCPVSYFVSENATLTGYVKKFYVALKDCD